MSWRAASSLLLGLALVACASFTHKECVVCSSVRVGWLWPQVALRFWSPPSTAHPILHLHLSLSGTNSSLHEIQVFSNSSVRVTGLEEDEDVWVEGGEEGLGPGWTSIHLTFDNKVTLSAHGHQLVSYHTLQPVQEVLVLASNLTVNCHSGVQGWDVRGGQITVPLDNETGWFSLATFSTQPCQPTFHLGNVTLQLGWSATGLALSAPAPLPPNRNYSFILDCTEMEQEDVSCSLKTQLTVLASFLLPSKPVALHVDGTGQNPFILLQDITAQPPPPVPPSTIRPPKPSPTSHPHPQPGELDGWSGWWVVFTVLLAVVIVVVVCICIVSHYHRPTIDKYLQGLNLNFISEATQEPQTPELCLERRPLLVSSMSVISTQDPKSARLWSAVAGGDEGEVSQVVATLGPDPSASMPGRETSPYEEAHHRGHTSLIKVLETFMQQSPEVPHNDMILHVMEVHMKKVEEVFASASSGQYRYAGGVDVLLRAYSLPGTIQDHRGNSLLHYAASARLSDQGPLWLANDIRSLVQQHGLLLNAVNFTGSTALHSLAESCSTSEEITCWDGKTLAVWETWVNLAEVLVGLGCSPHLADHHNHTPAHLAALCSKTHMAHWLSQRVEEAVEVEELGDWHGKFRELVEAASRGQVGRLQELVEAGVPLLPLGSTQDPLLQAIVRGHRDAVFLLLSAGAPLCAHGLLGNTPFEAAHTTPGLPALLPAIIRRVFCDQLSVEMELLTGGDDVRRVLREGLDHLRLLALNSGHQLGEDMSSWLDQWPAKGEVSYTDMVALAASLGLTLTCQLLGVAGVQVYPLPGHPHPLAQALHAHHHHTAYALCRDLKMNPFSCGYDLHTLSQHLASHLTLCDLHKLERKLRKKDISHSTVDDLLSFAKCDNNKVLTEKQLKTFLYLLAEISLVTILHTIRKKQETLDIDVVVHEASGSTMLHIAAAYGRLDMVEYLLSHGANHIARTSGGLSALQMAAVRGQHPCVDYLSQQTRAQGMWQPGPPPSSILDHFRENMRQCHLDLISCEEANTITAAKGDYARARLILSLMFEKLALRTSSDFQKALADEEKNMKVFNIANIMNVVKQDIDILAEKIAHVDKRFSGSVVCFPKVMEKMVVFLPDDLYFYLEVDSFSALPGGCVTVHETEEQEKMEHKQTVSSTIDEKLFHGSSFRNAFCRAAQEALGLASFQSLTLVPPFLAHSTTGIHIHAAFQWGEQRSMFLVRVRLTPILRCSPPTTGLDTLPRRLQTDPWPPRYEHLANTSEGTWVILLNIAASGVLKRVKKEEEQVLQACVYLLHLLETCWWLPKQEERRSGHWWHAYPVGVSVPTATSLKAAFIADLGRERKTAEGHWVERAIRVLRSMDHSQPNLDDLIHPQWETKASGAVQASVQFLQGLLKRPVMQS